MPAGAAAGRVTVSDMARTPRTLTSLGLAAVLCVGALAGCSGQDDDATATPTTAPSTSASAGADSAAPSPSTSRPPAPEGTQWVATASSGLRFAAPDDWKVFDTDTLTTDRDEGLIKELTQTYDVTEEQLGQIFASMDLVVIGPAQDGFAPNVNVVPNPLTALPEASELASELEKIGATAGTPRDVTTELGPAIVVPYSVASGTNEVKGRSIVLEGPDGFVTITVSDVTDEAAEDLTEQILSTVGRT